MSPFSKGLLTSLVVGIRFSLLAIICSAYAAVPPGIISVKPAANVTGVQSAAFEAIIGWGENAPGLITLHLDETLVTPHLTTNANTATIRYLPQAPLERGSQHTYRLTLASESSTNVAEFPFRLTFTPLPIGSLFIEAEDFNFGRGQTVTERPIGMSGPYVGGAFQDLGDGLNSNLCAGSDYGIDYGGFTSFSHQPLYRPTTGVEAAKPNSPAGINRGSFDVKVNHIVGWTDSSEWMNYTREFPSHSQGAMYKVYARMSHGDSLSRRGGIFYQVTSDPSLCDQTLRKLGSFSAPWTGGWDSWPDAGTAEDALIPMKDDTGQEAYVYLNGKVTFRFEFAENCGDFDYLVLVPSVVVETWPYFISITPAMNASGVTDGALTAVFGEVTTLNPITTINLWLDGARVTPSVTRSPNQVTIEYTPPFPFAAGSTHTYKIDYTDANRIIRSVTNTFSMTHTPLPPGSKFIEAEDFDFNHGQTITGASIGMTGPYHGGAFAGKGNGLAGFLCDGSDFGVDYNSRDNANHADPSYRPNTAVEAAKRNGSAGLKRGAFNVRVNHIVGWTSVGEWLNYTREFPQENPVYSVYARMSHGDATPGARRGGILYRVPNGPSCDAVITKLGSFSGPSTGDWDVWPDAGTPYDALIPMKDDTGAPVLVHLSGKQTLRWEFAEQSGDFDYLVFVPSSSFHRSGPQSLKPANSLQMDDSGVFEAVFIPYFMPHPVESIALSFDDQPVSPTITHTNGNLIVSYKPPQPLAPGSTHIYKFDYPDRAGAMQSVTSRFSITFTPLPAETLFIEAEDFNFNRGQTVTDIPIGMDGPYAGGAFFGLGNGLDSVPCANTDAGTDYNDDTINSAPNYRANASVETTQNPSAGFRRNSFSVQNNQILTHTSAGEWLNYTRTFPPTGQYKVYARISHGDPAPNIRRGGRLYEVTSNRHLCATNQTTHLLGNFSAPSSGDWNAWPDAGTPQDAFIPLKDAADNIALISLTGQRTLRFEFAEDAGHLDYLAFVPVFPAVTADVTASGYTITFEGSLEVGASPNGPFIRVNATSPYTPPISKSQQYFRARR